MDIINVEAIKELGSFGVLVYAVLFLLPKQGARFINSMDRLGANIEKICLVFASHDTRSVAISENMVVMQQDLKDIKSDMVTRDSLNRIHERLDEILLKKGEKENAN